MSIKARLTYLIEGIYTLLYPTLCLHCQRNVETNRVPQLCLSCADRLCPTEYWELPENTLTDLLRGRLEIRSASALYFFRTGMVCQSLIHALKYYHHPEVGQQLGRLLGEHLRQHPELTDLYGIVPVPLHPKRQYQRGYNQAECIAQGLAQVLEVPVFPEALRRITFQGSQTKRNRFERVENVARSFAPGKGDFRGKHLLLVDDVMTTGATLDFCGNVLLEQHPGATLSIAVLAKTES